MSEERPATDANEYDWFVAEDPADWKTVDYDPAWYDHTARVAIDRPHDMNSYVLGTLKELCAGIERAMGDDAVQQLVLTGAGDAAFCTGGNVDEYAEKYNRRPNGFLEWGEYYGRVFDLLLHCGLPVIARVNGVVAGGGWEFVSACDLAIAAEDARFIAPGPRVGMTSVGGLSQWLPLHMSHKRSAKLVLLSEEIDAAEALEIGAINEVVAADELDATVHGYLDRMNELSPTSLQYYKTQHNWWKDLVWRLTWEGAKSWFSLNMGAVEPSEGLWSFKERREADMAGIREELADGRDMTVPHGPYRVTCEACDSRFLPADSNFCLDCGAELEAD
jgi:enoyl-CoA hydratase/carnithine racemase